MAVAFRVEEINTFRFGFERNQSGSVKERKESTTVDGSMAVAMSVGGNAQTFRPWSWRERRLGEPV